MPKTLKEIVQFIDGELIGDEKVEIKGVAGIKEASSGDITFLANPKYLSYLDKTLASAIITSRDIVSCPKAIIRTDNPSLAFSKVISFIFPQESKHFKGINPTAILGKNLKLGKDIAIAAYVVLEDDVFIGDNTIIYPGCYIGCHSVIGSNSLIYPNVTIGEHITIGNRVIIHSGTVIGSDGFGYVTVEGRHRKIPQLGMVVIGDDVEIGANVTIDRARFEKTVIGRGTKIDNLVQIAHNVIIGEDCLIVAQVGISGSSSIGNNVILAGQVGVVGHITIGDNSVVMAKSGVSKDLPAGTSAWGIPAKPQDIAKKVNACVQNLPRMHETLRKLKNKIDELEKRNS